MKTYKDGTRSANKCHFKWISCLASVKSYINADNWKYVNNAQYLPLPRISSLPNKTTAVSAINKCGADNLYR